ncbi:hypothetical protein Tco_1186834 [Tanacetum coccineum]
MSTPTYVDSESIIQADGAQSSRVPVPLPNNPYVAVSQAQLVDTYTESDLEEAPSEVEESQSIGSRVPLMGEEFEAFELSGTRTDSSHSSVSSDSTAPLSPDHPLTHVSPTPTPTHASFHRRTASFHKRCRSSYETPSSSLYLALPVWKRYQDADGEGEMSDDKGHGSDDKGRGLEGEGLARRRALEPIEEITPSTYEIGQSSRFMPEQQGADKVSAFRQPTLTTWVDPEDDKVYTDIIVYPQVAPIQTPLSPEWSFDSFLVSPSTLVVPSPIASPVATPTSTISVDEDHFLEVEVQLELHKGILHDHTQHLDALPPTMFMDIDRDMRELYTRQEWLEMSSSHRVQQAAMQRELREMRDRVTALEQKRDRKEQ